MARASLISQRPHEEFIVRGLITTIKYRAAAMIFSISGASLLPGKSSRVSTQTDS
jgi:hypothetical protein